MFNLYRKVVTPVFAAVALGLLILVMAACGSVAAASTLGDSLANASQQSNHQSVESYSFKTLDDQADPTFNQLLGINNHGKIAGYFGSGTVVNGTLHPNKGYTLSKPYHTRVAAIPLLNCSLTPNITGILSHIHNHLGAMVQSPGVLREQVTQAGEISTELDVINAWLGQIHQDARQLVALDNPHLVQDEGIRLRGEINSLATRVLNGGIDPSNGRAEKGVTAIAEQIQQLATMDITRY